MKINDIGLLNMSGQQWKNARSSILPAFSLSKLKNMTSVVDSVRPTHIQNHIFRQLGLFVQVAKIVVEEVDKKGGKSFEMAPIIRGFAMDCITRLLYSVDTDSTRNPDNEWCTRATDLISVFGFTLSTVAPYICYLFNISVLTK